MDTLGPPIFVIYGEVVLSSEVSTLERGPQSVSFIERLFSLRRLKIEKGPQSQSVSFTVFYKLYSENPLFLSSYKIIYTVGPA